MFTREFSSPLPVKEEVAFIIAGAFFQQSKLLFPLEGDFRRAHQGSNQQDLRRAKPRTAPPPQIQQARKRKGSVGQIRERRDQSLLLIKQRQR